MSKWRLKSRVSTFEAISVPHSAGSHFWTYSIATLHCFHSYHGWMSLTRHYLSSSNSSNSVKFCHNLWRIISVHILALRVTRKIIIKSGVNITLSTHCECNIFIVVSLFISVTRIVYLLLTREFIWNSACPSHIFHKLFCLIATFAPLEALVLKLSHLKSINWLHNFLRR